MKSLKELCLASGGQFSPERFQQLEQTLVEDHRTDMPWYLRSIVGIGAWLASFFFLACAITLIGSEEDHRQTFACLGFVILIIAVVVGRQPWGVFAGQCALAVSLAGQAMIYFGLVDEHRHPLATIAAMAIAISAILYVAFPSFLSRLMTCLAALQIALFWIYAGNDGDLFSSTRERPDISLIVILYWGLHLATICVCFLRSRHSTLLAPLGYAAIASLCAWQVENLYNVWWYTTMITYSPAGVMWLFSHLQAGLTALTLFSVSVWAVGGVSTLRERPLLFIGLAVALIYLVAIGAGGILLALLFMLLGFSLQQRALLWLGIIFFLIFLTNYYYSLNLDLLMKSGVLIGSGVVMLVLRASLSRWVFINDKEVA